jgi:hypothetical protein
MKSLTAAFVLFLSSFSTAHSDDPIRQVALEVTQDVQSRFTYVEAPPDETFVYYGSEDIIEGDCDDYVSAAYFQLWKRELDPIVYVYDDRTVGLRHTIVCVEKWCLDNNERRPLLKSHALSQRGLVIVAEGKLNEEKMMELFLKEVQNIGFAAAL